MKTSLRIALFACLAGATSQSSVAADPTISELFLRVDQAVVEITTEQDVVADQGPAQ